MRGRDRPQKETRKGDQTHDNMEQIQAVSIHIYTGGGGGGMKREGEELGGVSWKGKVEEG